MKHIFIVNKIAGKGRGLKSVPTIKRVLEAGAYDYAIKVTEYPGHAKELAAEYSQEDTTVYAVGGDGTVLEVLNGLKAAGTMGIIPAGSGNDFYRLIGDSNTELAHLIKDTVEAQVHLIDYGLANDLKFLNGTSVGIDSDVNFEASKLIRNTFITKGVAYLLAIFKNVLVPKAKHLKITYDDKELNDDFLITAVMNGRFYGNGIKASPNSIVTDGYFDLVLVKDMPHLAVYPALLHYLSGKHLHDPHFTFIKAKKITIESVKKMSVQSDGENYESNKLTLTIKEKALRLKVPSYLKIII